MYAERHESANVYSAKVFLGSNLSKFCVKVWLASSTFCSNYTELNCNTKFIPPLFMYITSYILKKYYRTRGNFRGM